MNCPDCDLGKMIASHYCKECGFTVDDRDISPPPPTREWRGIHEDEKERRTNIKWIVVYPPKPQYREQGFENHYLEHSSGACGSEQEGACLFDKEETAWDCACAHPITSVGVKSYRCPAQVWPVREISKPAYELIPPKFDTVGEAQPSQGSP